MHLQDMLVSRNKMHLQQALASRQKWLRIMTVSLWLLVTWHYGIIVGSGLKLLVVASWNMLLDLVVVLGRFWDHLLNLH